MKLSNRARLILETLLLNPEGVSRDQINEVLQKNGEEPVERRRLFKYFTAFRTKHNLNIAVDHLGGTSFRYRLNDNTGRPRGLSALMASTMLEVEFLQTYRDLGARIQPYARPHGSNFLLPIGEAMSKNKLIRVTYQKFSDIEPYDCILAPHALKIFEGRWYLFAVKWMSESEIKSMPLGYKGYGLQSFALDRMLNVSMTRRRLELLKGFDAETFFEPFFGVYCHMGDKPKKILVHASEEDAHYIRTLPIHHSQKEVEHNEFTLKLVPARDFEIYMRRFPDTTWEVVKETRGRKPKANEA